MPRLLIVIVSSVLLGAPALAQVGGDYNLRWNTIDGGGATSLSGGPYTLGGTAGQADAGSQAGGLYELNGGFWNGVAVASSATPTFSPAASSTLTRTVTGTMAASATPTLTAAPPTGAATLTPSATLTPTRSATAGASPATPTPTGTQSPTAIGTASPPCVGDCDSEDDVTVDEIILMVNVALGTSDVSACLAGDVDENAQITVDEILAAVTNALDGCVS